MGRSKVKMALTFVLLTGCAGVPKEGATVPKTVASCPMPAPKPKPVTSMSPQGHLGACTDRDVQEIEAIAVLAATGLVATGGCEDLDDCPALQNLSAAIGRLARRACLETL